MPPLHTHKTNTTNPTTISERLLLGHLQPVTKTMLDRLDNIRFDYHPTYLKPGLLYWNDHTWIALINSQQSVYDQLFDALHNLKHAIDHPNRIHLYRCDHITDHTNPDAEQAADQFAYHVLNHQTTPATAGVARYDTT